MMPVILGRRAAAVHANIFISRRGLIDIVDEFDINHLFVCGLCYNHLGSHKDGPDI